ncbi:hypothetical protein WOLCODRAFT_154500 [Wolfiporia cocos MD-104 SS10]|uniref:Tc1-like transposase DDE domain-containing protein n=1 Tax=Wolfiporia cocos (strain MD-104) TaxID=742152 RepID=A0A2H3K2V1_WOLCO|nr:hypothetical protein WOLCODRAFT_154500 [Wolfiporia cocos MD-104 SS10]
MDGHEREDVKKYRQEVFLPQMARLERRMAHFEGPELTRVAPTLVPGETEVVAVFHDESCFHVNEYKRSAWLAEGQTILQRKGRGHLIHVSDFITSETGRLIQYDVNGTAVRDAQRIIYPGTNGDPWWDTDQLIKDSFEIVEAAFPGRTIAYIFDQSSAHASLPPNALRAFDMNKSDGGKQRTQRDTIIPESNPYMTYRGQPQAMTLPDGRPKGLQRVLEERGFDVQGIRAKCSPVCPWENSNCCMARLLSKQDDFANQLSMLETVITEAGHICIFLPKFHCELNPIEMYWDWCKYRYREVPKKTFAEAKKVAIEKLNACPVDDSQGKQLCGLFESRSSTARFPHMQ